MSSPGLKSSNVCNNKVETNCNFQKSWWLQWFSNQYEFSRTQGKKWRLTQLKMSGGSCYFLLKIIKFSWENSISNRFLDQDTLLCTCRRIFWMCRWWCSCVMPSIMAVCSALCWQVIQERGEGGRGEAGEKQSGEAAKWEWGKEGRERKEGRRRFQIYSLAWHSGWYQ